MANFRSQRIVQVGKAHIDLDVTFKRKVLFGFTWQRFSFVQGTDAE